jgi:hypothetical protein
MGFVLGDPNKPYSIKSLIQQDCPDLKENAEFQKLESVYAKVSGQVRQNGLFNTAAQLQNSIYDASRYTNSISSKTTSSSKFELVSTRLSQKKGTAKQSIQQIFSSDRSVKSNYTTQTDVLKITKEIASFISDRQSIMKQLHNAIRNIEQGLLVNNDPDAQRSVLFPSLVNGGKTQFPSVIAHMIEDETEEDLGPGSGGRYIIKENQIISLTIEENPPEFTVTEVNGLFGEGLAGSPTAGFEMGYGGNGIVSAIGVDYDLWRMYGFKVSKAIPAPYISDPDTQAAPLATWMLTEQRRKIISGSVTIIGNEYMQPGEVVYIESRDLLFYVQNVAHNFTYGTTFTTTLKLTYGHNPGEYFPTMLDIIGKGLYSKRNNSNAFRNIRADSADGYQHIGVIIADTAAQLGAASSDVATGTYGGQNRKALTSLILTLQGASASASGLTPRADIRYYYNSTKGFPLGCSKSRFLSETCAKIVSWLKNPTKQESGKTGSLMPDTSAEGLKLSNIDKCVHIFAVDLGDTAEGRSPSSPAWYAAREAITDTPAIFPDVQDITQSQGGQLHNNNNTYKLSVEELAIYTNIIDIWVHLEEVSKTNETSSFSDANISQAQQASAALLKNAANAAKG